MANFAVFTELLLKIQILWDVTPLRLVKRNSLFIIITLDIVYFMKVLLSHMELNDIHVVVSYNVKFSTEDTYTRATFRFARTD